jgi:hypothetical protein
VTRCLWWPPGHVAGRHLASYLAARDPGVRPGLEWHPNGLPVAVPAHAEPGRPAPSPGGRPSAEAMRDDAIARQLMAMRRVGRTGEQLGVELERRLRRFERHEREVINQLRAAGT